ncbi:MAG: hypothetical protein IKY38_04890 [Anaerotignum sp.]|nr:hypothetical protein [Anaerotignum sp.]
MNIDKKKLVTFLCAMWPGGGYMYHGMMKKGAILMAAFTALLGLTMTIGWKFLAFLLPVIWCYCFFDTFHVAKLHEEIRAMEDQDCFDKVVNFCKDDPLKKVEDKKTFLGVLILLVALYTLIYGVLMPFFRWGEQFYWVQVTLSVIPTAVVAVLLFMVGKNILQKEQDRKEAEIVEIGEEVLAEEVEESTLEEGNVEELVEAVLEAEVFAEVVAETEETVEVVAEEIAEAEEKMEEIA